MPTAELQLTGALEKTLELCQRGNGVGEPLLFALLLFDKLAAPLGG